MNFNNKNEIRSMTVIESTLKKGKNNFENHDLRSKILSLENPDKN